MFGSGLQKMDNASDEASLELADIREKHTDGVQAIEEWAKKWVSSARYKRLVKISTGRWE